MSLGPVAQQIWPPLQSAAHLVAEPMGGLGVLRILSPALECIHDAFALIRSCSRIVPTRGATGSHAH